MLFRFDPLHQPVKPIPMPLGFAGATLQTGEEVLHTPQFTVPLVLALEYAQRHRAELERTYPAPELYQRCVQALFAKT